MVPARWMLSAALLLVAGCSPPVAKTTDAASAKSASGCDAGAPLPDSDAALKQVRLCIYTGTAVLPFAVELADTPEQQARGMMFRSELADDKGMLFPFPRERIANFWMKNMVIPLDLIFVRRDGTIESIAADAIPYDTSTRASGEPVIAVLELRGGLAAIKGIKAGDRVLWAANER